MRRLCLIVNPRAGGGRTSRALPGVEAALRERGVEFRVELTSSLEHAGELGLAASESGEVAVSFGGDGLAGAVAHALRGTRGLLGVLPGGRGNDFARKLGIPRDPVKACGALADGSERVVDVGDVDGRTFLGIASYGFDSDVQDIADGARVVSGRLVYPYATVRRLVSWKPVRLSLAIDGGPAREIVGYSVAACNSGMFGGGMALAPGADLEDGILDVVTIGAVPRLRYLWNIPKVFRGTHLRVPAIELIRAREIRVDAEKPFRIYADGDPIGTTPATVRAIPGALRVLAP